MDNFIDSIQNLRNMDNIEDIKSFLEVKKQDFNKNLEYLNHLISLNKISEAKAFIDNLKSEYTSKKGIIHKLLSNLPKVDISIKREYGKLVNELKEYIENNLKEKLNEINKLEAKIKYQLDFDLSIDYFDNFINKNHILDRVINELEEVFLKLGFSVFDGNEIDNEYYNFEVLNIDKYHPARDMWDTFYISNDLLLRTHTSNMQVRIMQKLKPPFKVITYGKCYRRDNLDATHSFQFHQLEGFAVDKDISFLDLIKTLYDFVKLMFGKDIDIKLVPSYFPFTEPSAEVYISCIFCKGKDSNCSICKGSGYLEILGCGMINPIILNNLNLSDYTGFAFGMGIERIAMLKYRISDIRFFYKNNFNSIVYY
ncbi:MAG: phenylalanine--tRNA ligase subunit alpha [bacterium]|jgi:phenylalanyl-tRNA synthetase alpha chain